MTDAKKQLTHSRIRDFVFGSANVEDRYFCILHCIKYRNIDTVDSLISFKKQWDFYRSDEWTKYKINNRLHPGSLWDKILWRLSAVLTMLFVIYLFFPIVI